MFVLSTTLRALCPALPACPPACLPACSVVDVQYVIANDGTDHTLAQLTLSLTDESSPLKVNCADCI